jgi:hypothetical protein
MRPVAVQSRKMKVFFSLEIYIRQSVHKICKFKAITVVFMDLVNTMHVKNEEQLREK